MTVVCEELFKVHRTPEGDAAALQGLTLRAEAGEMLAVLGPSGSGKSTLLRILAGLERPSAGTALVDGYDMARLPAAGRQAVRRERIGLVGQEPESALSPALSVGEALTMPMGLRGTSPGRARRQATELLAQVGLPPAAMRAWPAELSGGERQRAAICAALGHRPAVVLADEPTGELDAASAAEVLALLRDLADQRSATVLLVTHDPAGAAQAHRVVRIRDGRVSAEQHGDQHAVVIGQGGWLHVPEELLDAAGIESRALIRAAGRSVVLEPVSGATPTVDPAPEPSAARLDLAVPEPAGASVAGLGKAYGSRQVFSGFDAVFEPATMTAVQGRSGSGKSTLLRLLAGLERPDAGQVTVAGLSVGGRSREALAALRADHVAVVAQDVVLAGFLSALEQVELPLLQRGLAREQARGRAAAWLGAVGLTARAGQRVGRLSAGERQRVAIARAVASGRGLVLVDEPTSRLDEANARAVSLLLRRLADDHRVTVVCATHDPILVEQAHRVVPLSP